MEGESFQEQTNQLNYQSPQSKKKSKKVLYLILFVILLPIVVFGIQNIFFGSEGEEETAQALPTPTEYQFPTDTPTPTPSPDPDEEDSGDTNIEPEEEAVDPVDKETGLDRSDLSVEVQNGSGIAGEAGKAADILKGFGYKIASTGNADNFDYEGVTIQVKSTKTNFLELLRQDLGFSYAIVDTSSDLDSSSTADALVIIGQ
jgi:hypothetical protein